MIQRDDLPSTLDWMPCCRNCGRPASQCECALGEAERFTPYLMKPITHQSIDALGRE